VVLCAMCPTAPPPRPRCTLCLQTSFGLLFCLAPLSAVGGQSKQQQAFVTSSASALFRGQKRQNCLCGVTRLPPLRNSNRSKPIFYLNQRLIHAVPGRSFDSILHYPIQLLPSKKNGAGQRNRGQRPQGPHLRCVCSPAGCAPPPPLDCMSWRIVCVEWFGSGWAAGASTIEA
jgi:hypothetical protein